MRFVDAVPRRRDRRELRHALRATTRHMARERRRHVAAVLEVLASSHVRVSAIRSTVSDSTIVEFRDGTVLDLEVREGEARLRRLGARIPPAAYLESAVPCLGGVWFQLHFAAMFDHASVTAQVRHIRMGGRAASDGPDRGEEAGHAKA